jgi:hypothetical protein
MSIKLVYIPFSLLMKYLDQDLDLSVELWYNPLEQSMRKLELDLLVEVS